jgi:hypothetical protein
MMTSIPLAPKAPAVPAASPTSARSQSSSGEAGAGFDALLAELLGAPAVEQPVEPAGEHPDLTAELTLPDASDVEQTTADVLATPLAAPTIAEPREIAPAGVGRPATDASAEAPGAAPSASPAVLSNAGSEPAPVTSAVPPSPSAATSAPGIEIAALPGPAPAASSTPAVPVTAAQPVAAVSIQPVAPAPEAAEAAAPAPAQAQAPDMHKQLAPRITRLVTSGDGQHQITVRVDPEEFGPVRVVANISGDDVSVVLHASNEQGREALRVAMADLRRDLEATGLRGSLDLATGSGNGGDRRPETGAHARPGSRGGPDDVPATAEPPAHRSTVSAANLDVLV